MSIVVVERSFETPVEFADLFELQQANGACLQRCRVRARYSLFARDRRQMVCIYDAPDADAVRATQDEGKLPYDCVWSARQLNFPPVEPKPRYETVVVQRELPIPVTYEQVEAGVQAVLGCLQRNRASMLGSLLALDGRRMLCRYSAPDAESVRNANVQAELPFTRAWPASLFGDAS